MRICGVNVHYFFNVSSYKNKTDCYPSNIIDMYCYENGDIYENGVNGIRVKRERQ